MFNSKKKDILDTPIATITRGEVIPCLVVIGYVCFYTFLSFLGISLIATLIYVICFIVDSHPIYLTAAIASFLLLMFPILIGYCLINDKDVKILFHNFDKYMRDE